MKLLRLLVVVVVANSIIFGCSAGYHFKRSHYANLIDYNYSPVGKKGAAVCMADMGAWHGLTLPDTTESIFGVAGPYLLGEYAWAGKYLTKFGDFDNIIGESYPGYLRLKGDNKKLEADSKSFYISGNSHMNIVTIHNGSDSSVYYNPEWNGLVFSPLSLNVDGNRLYTKTKNGILVISFKNSTDYLIECKDDTIYSAKYTSPVKIPSGKEVKFVSVVSYLPFQDNFEKEKGIVDDALDNSDAAWEKNEVRWNGYIQKSVRADITNLDYVPIKAIQTLITNWKKPIGDIKHQGVVPSMSVAYFNGFWAWDSWKHSVALKEIEPDLAKDQIRAMFDYQDSSGMVIDCIFPDKSENNLRDSKPPLAGWAVWEVFSSSNDTAFVREMLPKLEKYHRWWYKYRDHDNNGLCEYGSTDGTLIAAKWESGMDNAVRFDSSEIVNNNEGAWSINQESVDLNAYLYAEKIYLEKLCNVVGLTADAYLYSESASLLKEKINSSFFNSDKGYYFDRKIDKRQHIEVAGPEGWTPLWCMAADSSKVKSVSSIMLDTLRFNTFVPFPTLDASHPSFAKNGYWRGPVWLDQVYFAISSLRKNGMNDKADSLTFKLFNNLEGLSGSHPIFENYDAHTGEGLSAPNFSWSAAHLLLLYKELKTKEIE